MLEGSGYLGGWPGLDPATDTSDAANSIYMDSIYGDLFEQGKGNQILPDLATGYSFADGGKAVTIRLRPGVRFSDGTPFNASAVAFNIKRDLDPKYACLCDANFPVSSIDTPNPTTVVLHLTKVFAPIIEAFFGEAPNWIVSPSALSKMGERAFALKPVGAGPFTVGSDQPSTKLVLERNPHYWNAGHPYLDTLTFSSVGTDQTALEAVQTGQAQAYQGLGLPLVATARKDGLTVTTIPSTLGPDMIQLNTQKAPFDKIAAREAIYYATDPEVINKALEQGTGEITQSMTGPGDLFDQPKVPGYRTYDLAKAKALVKQLGGLSVNLESINSSATDALMEALKSQWAEAGIDTTIVPQTLEAQIQTYQSKSWQAALSTTGGYDPAIGTGLAFRYLSTGPFTGVKDPKLDQLITRGVSVLSVSARTPIYKQIDEYISQKAYTPFLFNIPGHNVTAKGVSGPGLTTGAFQILWEDVSVG